MKLFTIGHSNLNIDEFIRLLQLHQITAVADVRSSPYSQYLPHFNQSPLKEKLLSSGIRYVFLGEELGARPKDLSCYVNGKAIYERIAATELFQRGIERILKGIQTYKVALMCAEKDPITCHRTILVCEKLKKYNLDISHILSDGTLESHERLENRLLILHKFKAKEDNNIVQLDLFSNPQPQDESKLLEIAYQRQGDKIAYQVTKNNNYDSED